jgi:hypothetical protein
LNFLGEEKLSRLPSKNQVAVENLHFQRHTNFLIKLQCSVLKNLFISYFVFRRQPAEFFLSQKIYQIKAGQNKQI